MTLIAPSILSADFANLSRDIGDVRAGGADWLHIDVMDGLFVPNISIGIPVVKSVRKSTDMFLDVHLMIDRPHRYVADFLKAGADMLCFHVEADEPQDLFPALDAVHAAGKKCGLAIKPRTPASVLIPYLDRLDMALVMTVEPGFGGQSFMADMLPKIAELRRMIDASGREVRLQVDGGVDDRTAPLVKAAGADVLVAGSYVFGKPDRNAAIDSLRQ